MAFEELIGILFVLYILGSIVAGFLRGAGGRPAQPGQPPVYPEVLDMDELERRLREAREREHPPESRSPADEFESEPPMRPSPERTVAATVQRASERAATTTMLRDSERAATTTMRRAPERATFAGRTPLQPSRVRDADNDWGDDADDAEWEALERSEGLTVRPGSRNREMTPPRSGMSSGRVPEPVQAFLERGNPWQAAFVVKEVLGPPRALSPYRTWPRV